MAVPIINNSKLLVKNNLFNFIWYVCIVHRYRVIQQTWYIHQAIEQLATTKCFFRRKNIEQMKNADDKFLPNSKEAVEQI